MARLTIVWRNPSVVKRSRIWNQAWRDGKSALYVVVRSVAQGSEWEGLPSLEVLEGGASERRSNRGVSRGA